MVYIKNIEVDEEETDESIGHMVRDHCKANGIRVMQWKVIRFKTVHDVVGCRILVPISEERKTMNSQIWPKELEVRLWENFETWRSKWGGNRGQGYGQNYENRAWDDDDDYDHRRSGYRR